MEDSCTSVVVFELNDQLIGIRLRHSVGFGWFAVAVLEEPDGGSVDTFLSAFVAQKSCAMPITEHVLIKPTKPRDVVQMLSQKER